MSLTKAIHTKEQQTQQFYTFVEVLEHIQKNCTKGVSLQTLLTLLSGKGKLLFLIVLALPFGKILGISIFCGFLIAFLGIRLTLGENRIWLPKFILQKTIQPERLQKTLKQILPAVKKIIGISRMRYEWVCCHPIMKKINGLSIALMGLCLALSPSIPFCGYIPLVAIFLLAIGLLNNDGLFITIAYPIVLFDIVFVVLSMKYFSLMKILE
jgi:hypothetical protein